MIGRKLSHFRVEEQIGAGGMGVVYRGHDERLDRPVAIKVLPAGSVGDDAARARFRAEASLLARLNHPNIAIIHEFDHSDGLDFLVMEYISGEGLDDLVARGPLPEDTIRSLGEQLCSGLEAAHSVGIIHRDLKPANLRVTPDGRLKILDFGVAKLVLTGPARTTAVTERTPGIAGTPPYMAPEQIAGGIVDARTDIHAVGAVLYEMSTAKHVFAQPVQPAQPAQPEVEGRPPSAALAGSQLASAILHQTPTAPRKLNLRLSPNIERIILKCLEKDPSRRYASARDLAKELRPSPTDSGVALAIAVIPFQNLGGDRDTDYLRLALPETVATTLSRIPSLAVRPLAVTRKHLGDIDLEAIGRDLRVGALITGAFALQPAQIRVSLEAIDVERSRVLWSDTILVATDALVTLPNEIATRLQRDFLPAFGLTPTESRMTRPANHEAYELYLRSVAMGMDSRPNAAAIEMLDRAVQLDPGFAPAWMHLGRRHYLDASFGSGGVAGYQKSEEAYHRALALDPELIAAATGLVHHLVEKGELRAAWDIAARLLERRPDSSAAHMAMSYVYRYAGLNERAAEHADTALSLDRDEALGSCGLTFLALENYQRAREFLALRAGTGIGENLMMFVLMHEGNYDEALKVATRLSSDPVWPARFIRAFLEKRPAEEVARLADEFIQYAVRLTHDPEANFLDAAVMSFCGLEDKAIALLRQAIRGGFCAYPHLETDPLLENVRKRPEYPELLAEARQCRTRFEAYLRERTGSGRGFS